MNKTFPLAASVCMLTSLIPISAGAVTVDYALRATAAFQADGDPDLGQASGKDAQNVFLNLAPRALIEFGPDWTGFIRGRVFVPSGSIQPFDSNEPNNANARTKSFAELSELSLQYNGITSYPGEAIRFGRQRIRQDGSEFFDDDIDALRWVYDTTELGFDTGVAHQFSTYSTDSAPISALQRRRTYLFGNLYSDWRPRQRFGARVVHSIDSGSAPALGENLNGDSKTQNAELTWLGAYVDNGFYNPISRDPLLYWAELNYLIGSQTIAIPGAGDTVVARQHQDVRAYSASGALRWHPLERYSPFSLGTLLTYSSGGGNGGDRSRQYQQTGLQSNATTFAGSRLLINRYNETLLADLGNLRVATAFSSLVFDDDEVSLIYSNFSRDESSAPIATDNVRAVTVTNSNDIGNGVDLVATHYFGRAIRAQRLLQEGDAYVSQERRSFVSIRGSAFVPGSAYGQNAKTDYRILLEATLWLN